jgi:hypothetical protein
MTIDITGQHVGARYSEQILVFEIVILRTSPRTLIVHDADRLRASIQLPVRSSESTAVNARSILKEIARRLAVILVDVPIFLIGVLA